MLSFRHLERDNEAARKIKGVIQTSVSDERIKFGDIFQSNSMASVLWGKIYKNKVNKEVFILYLLNCNPVPVLYTRFLSHVDFNEED